MYVYILTYHILETMLHTVQHAILNMYWAQYLIISLYRVQPVAAGCIIGWDAAMPLMQCPPYQYTGAHFADLGRMTG